MGGPREPVSDTPQQTIKSEGQTESPQTPNFITVLPYTPTPLTPSIPGYHSDIPKASPLGIPKTFDIPTAPTPIWPPSTNVGRDLPQSLPLGTRLPGADIVLFPVSLSPCRVFPLTMKGSGGSLGSNNSFGGNSPLTYDSFWSSHSTTTVNYQSLITHAPSAKGTALRGSYLRVAAPTPASNAASPTTEIMAEPQSTDLRPLHITGAFGNSSEVKPSSGGPNVSSGGSLMETNKPQGN